VLSFLLMVRYYLCLMLLTHWKIYRIFVSANGAQTSVGEPLRTNSIDCDSKIQFIAQM